LDGLEAVYESQLNSERMVRLTVMTDALRRPIPGLGWRYQEESGVPAGKNLVLTLDLVLQKKVEALLDQIPVAKGAVVIMEVGTGKIRALASRPVFDPYAPQQSLNHPDRPLLNRALQYYPSGHLFNLLIVAAALESGKVQPDAFFYDRQSGHGLITLTHAFAYGVPAVFQEVTAALEPASLWTLAETCGLGAGGRLGLPGEGTGLVPGKASKIETDLSTGEQEVAVTPVQMAALLQIVAGNGWYYPPVVVEGLQEPDGSWSAPPLVSLPNQPVLSEPTVRALQKMLVATVLYGTGQLAQVRQGAAGVGGAIQAGLGGEEPRLYSWFAGYAPAHDPRLVGVVFLEDDPAGAEQAAVLFASIMEGA
jgi:cell division protein FtsI/penicillin-binding protein 2